MNIKTSKSGPRRNSPALAAATVVSAAAILGFASHTGVAAGLNPSMSKFDDASSADGAPMALSAGPIHLKFADGELRYLYVGDKEIVRRIYFAVRNGKWETATPVFSKIHVHAKGDTFEIDLAATCNTKNVDYKWTAHIKGAADGTITYSARGESGAAFQSNRLGICVLFGTPAVTQKRFETWQTPLKPDGKQPGVFPEFVSPDLVRGKFNTLQYSPTGEYAVSTDVQGTLFDMEDQRTYGDSSFKAYAPLKYDYPNIPANTAASETVTVSLSKSMKSKRPPTHKAVSVEIGTLLPGAVIPTISVDAIPADKPNFGAVNGKQKALAGSTDLLWSYTTSIHLLDDDVFMENIHVIPDQVRSVHQFAPGAKITLNPIVINIHYGGEGSDPRGAGELGAAWSTAIVKQMAIAGVSDGVFATGPGLGAKFQKELAAFAGHKIYDLVVKDDGPYPPRIDGFVVEENGKPGKAYLFNRSSDTVTIKYAKAKGRNSLTMSFDLPGYSAISLDLHGLKGISP